MHDEPEAYQIGNIPFLGLTIYLDSRPLIPRVETEYWTELAIEELAKQRMSELTKVDKTWPSGPERTLLEAHEGAGKFKILDLCAGSGAIGCAFLKYVPNAKVYFGEIDPAHEPTIRKNIRENGLDASRTDIRIGDLFEPFEDLPFDFIAANPPYIPDARPLDRSVEAYEPALALRAGEDGLAIIRRIIMELPRRLAKRGAAWIECDTSNIEEARRFAIKHGLQTEILPDQYDRLRVLKCRHERAAFD